MRVDVVVIGAGPQGLAVAAHLRQAGVETHSLGLPMAFWKQHMPTGMLLRSRPRASNISHPTRGFTLSSYEAFQGRKFPSPLPIADFIDYGLWFQRHVIPDLDSRKVTSVRHERDGFGIELEDGERLAARRVVVATGMAPFPFRPPQFLGLPKSLVSHTFEHRDFSRFTGRRVVVVGGGQSALESAALLHEAGANVEVVVRENIVRWLDELRSVEGDGMRRRVHRIAHPPTGVGPPGLNWIVAIPDFYKGLPSSFRHYVSHRAIRPAGAAWLKSRLEGVPINTGRTVSPIEPACGNLRLALNDGTERVVDHVVLGTGYTVDISRYEFLPADLIRLVDCVRGYPVLGPGFESSLAGLHFVGAAAAHSYGPVMRFVVSGALAGREITRRVTGRPPTLLDFSW